MDQFSDPEDCTTMVEVRAGVDETDRQIAVLVARRFRYMDAAARIKPLRDQVRDEARKAQVLGNARTHAAAADYPADAAEAIWDVLIEASIAYELERFDAR